MDIDKSIKEAKSIQEVFKIVKRLVKEFLGLDQAGLMVGISDLGMHPQGYVGAFYNAGANMIIINRIPLEKVPAHEYNFYVFHILLHEYIHAIGSFDELQTRIATKEIVEHYLGHNHLATDIQKFHIPKELMKIEDVSIDFIENIDRDNMDYIG